MFFNLQVIGQFKLYMDVCTCVCVCVCVYFFKGILRESHEKVLRFVS